MELRFFHPEPPDASPSHLRVRWFFLRALGLVFFSAFLPLAFQINGLIGPDGILPARDWLHAVAQHFGLRRYWIAPSLLWLGSGTTALHLLVWAGLLASLLLLFNLAPRWSVLAATLLFLSFAAVAQDFSGYQSDGMLMAAGFFSIFFAPGGLRPGLGEDDRPRPVLRWLLLWVWFCIYFESGLGKMLSGDPQWRNFTAMDQYYQNGPLPTWIGWYAQHLPHRFHAATQFIVLFFELGLVWFAFLPRRARLLCFCLITPLQLGMMLTANYGFLNLIVLALGLLLLDDQALAVIPGLGKLRRRNGVENAMANRPSSRFQKAATWRCPEQSGHPLPAIEAPTAATNGSGQQVRAVAPPSRFQKAAFGLSCALLAWVFLASALQLLGMFGPLPSALEAPVEALTPFRVADRYGLFAVMTRGRYEIEFQGSNDGQTWIPYPFRFKPQDLNQRPKFFVPYQARFDWNLWFASLGPWREYPYVVYTQIRLLHNTPAVVKLFADNPFPGAPPRLVRTVIYQYWFTTMQEKHNTGNWWRRELLGRYSPTLALNGDGKVVVVQY